MKPKGNDLRCECDLGPRFGNNLVLRCGRQGARFRNGRWVCFRCYELDAETIAYVDADRTEAGTG
jgi:hypothetical protein